MVVYIMKKKKLEEILEITFKKKLYILK